MGKGTIMFGHGVRVTSSSNNIERVSADCAVEALAWMLGVQFRKDYGVVSAKGGLAYKLDVPLFKNGEREQLLDGCLAAPAYVSQTVRLPLVQAITAIADALGLELRGEYVVGSAKPQIVAVKKAPAKKAKK